MLIKDSKLDDVMPSRAWTRDGLLGVAQRLEDIYEHTVATPDECDYHY